MGNKHGKPRGSSGAKPRDEIPSTSARPQQQQQSVPAPPPQYPPQQQSAYAAPAVVAPPANLSPPPPPPPAPPVASAPVSMGKPPARPPAKSSQLEFKLSHVDVSTIFAPQEIQSIRKHLAVLLGQSESDPVLIPKDEFFRFLGTTSTSLYVNRLYTIFDLSNKGYVTFDDLVNGLSVLSQKATREQKLMLSFHLLDPEGTGYITKKMTTEMLRSCLFECRELEIDLSEEQIARIVNSTFDEADLDRNGLIDMHEYQALDAKHPGLSDFLTVDAFGVLNHLEKVHSMSISGGVASGVAAE